MLSQRKRLKPSQERRKAVYARANHDVYAQNPPRPVEEVANPFEGKEAEWYARFYGQLRRQWLWCEDIIAAM